MYAILCARTLGTLLGQIYALMRTASAAHASHGQTDYRGTGSWRAWNNTYSIALTDELINELIGEEGVGAIVRIRHR